MAIDPVTPPSISGSVFYGSEGGKGDHYYSRNPPTNHATDEHSLHDLRVDAFLLGGHDTGTVLGEQSAAENPQTRAQQINAVLTALGPWATPRPPPPPSSPPPPSGPSA